VKSVDLDQKLRVHIYTSNYLGLQKKYPEYCSMFLDLHHEKNDKKTKEHQPLNCTEKSPCERTFAFKQTVSTTPEPQTERGGLHGFVTRLLYHCTRRPGCQQCIDNQQISTRTTQRLVTLALSHIGVVAGVAGCVRNGYGGRGEGDDALDAIGDETADIPMGRDDMGKQPDKSCELKRHCEQVQGVRKNKTCEDEETSHFSRLERGLGSGVLCCQTRKKEDEA